MVRNCCKEVAAKNCLSFPSLLLQFWSHGAPLPCSHFYNTPPKSNSVCFWNSALLFILSNRDWYVDLSAWLTHHQEPGLALCHHGLKENRLSIVLCGQKLHADYRTVAHIVADCWEVVSQYPFLYCNWYRWSWGNCFWVVQDPWGMIWEVTFSGIQIRGVKASAHLSSVAQVYPYKLYETFPIQLSCEL